MSRDYRLPEYLPYAHMDVDAMQQPQQHQYQQQQPQHYPTHFPMQHQTQTLGNAGATPEYELTAAAVAAEAVASAATVEGVLPHTASLYPLDPRKRNTSHYGEFEMTDPQCSGSERSLPTAASASASTSASVSASASAVAGSTRKRKSSSIRTPWVHEETLDSGTGSSLDEEGDGSRSSSARNSYAPSDKKLNHSEIERRRRNMMNTYIRELSGMIPLCSAMARKLDKLSVLRLAVAHLRGVRGALTAGALSQRPRPALLPQRDLNALLLHTARAHDAFLFVVDCDGGRLLYASHTVHSTLRYQQTELVGQSLFDILHPKDVAKVKEQLSSSDLNPRERLIDAKTMLPLRSELVSGAQRLSPGARRSFFCRIKCKQSPDQPTEAKSQPPPPPPPPPAGKKDDGGKIRKKHEKKYCVVQCTGYLKSWTPVEVESGAGDEEEQASLSCLVAVCRTLEEPPAAAAAPPACRLQYVSRHALDGKFLFVDQRVRLALGFLPQELLGTSLYEYVSGAELGALARAHKLVLMRKHALHTAPYPFRRKDGSTATLQTHFKPFRNPWTKDIECLVANNTLLPDNARDEDAPHPCEPFKQTEEWRAYLRGGGQGSGSGGGQAAAAGPEGGAPPITESDSEVALLIASQVESHKIGACIAEEARRRPPTALPSPPHHLMNDPIFNASMDNILGMDLNAFTVRNNVPLSVSGGAPSPGAGDTAPAGSPPLSLDGNGEAAMAVIMSLLEADAGLGGPVNFNGFPWSLP